MNHHCVVCKEVMAGNPICVPVVLDRPGAHPKCAQSIMIEKHSQFLPFIHMPIELIQSPEFLLELETLFISPLGSSILAAR